MVHFLRRRGDNAEIDVLVLLIIQMHVGIVGTFTNDAWIFHALAENGTVTMPIAETFWAVRFGMLTDQFGTPWLINCEKPMS